MNYHDFVRAVGRNIEYYDGEWHTAILLSFKYSEKRGKVIACDAVENGGQIFLYDPNLENLVRTV